MMDISFVSTATRGLDVQLQRVARDIVSQQQLMQASEVLLSRLGLTDVSLLSGIEFCC